MKNKILKLFWLLCILFFMGVLGGISILTYFSLDLPKISTLEDYRPAIPSRILAKDGTVLLSVGTERRTVVKFEEIPQLVVDSFLSAEDSGFYNHKGVDYLGVLRALIVNLKAGKVVQGGSTITQQVAKSLLLSRERSISRKIKDFLLARKIEEKFTKQEILFLYLNQVYLGGGYYGVKEAFNGYYGKDLDESTPAECAMIAGLLVAPGRYSPYVNPKYAKKRQRYVLNRMYMNGKITRDQYQQSLVEKIKFKRRKRSEFKAGYFTDWVRQRVIGLVGEDKFLQDGFTIVTTLDWELQKVAEKGVYDGVKAVDKRQGFKGPVGHIELVNLSEFNIKARTEILRDKSSHFTIDDEYKRNYEFVYDEDELNRLIDYRNNWQSEVLNNNFVPGLLAEDRLIKALRKDKMYDAVVLKTDDLARIIYISIGGIPGIIPYKNFRWAHERKIIENRHYFPYLTKPSTILIPGDIVKVSIKEVEAKIGSHLYKKFVDRFSKNEKYKKFSEEKFIIAELDQEPDVQGALVSLNPESGEVISFVGGANFDKSQFNRAIQSQRQPGSSFKPFLFAAALENGYNPASIIIDSPEALGGGESNVSWKPRNYDGKFKGPITFRNALEQSRNIPTIKIADALGVKKVLSFANRIGLNAKIDEDLSLSLGAFGVTLLDLVSTYAIFPNGGKVIDAKTIVSITDRDGNLYNIDENYRLAKIKEKEVIDNSNESEDKLSDSTLNDNVNPYYMTLGGEQVYDPRLAYIMTNLLHGVVLHGTGRRAKTVSTFLGGKTGTTNNYIDALFVGFSSNIVTGVWTGFDNNKTLGWGETGAKSALPIWKKFMAAGLKKFGEYDFDPPAGIINVLVNKETGKPAKDGQKGSFMEAFVEGDSYGTDSSEQNESSETKNDNTILDDDEYYNNQ